MGDDAAVVGPIARRRAGAAGGDTLPAPVVGRYDQPMAGVDVVQVLAAIVALLGVAAVVAIVIRPLRVPYSVALVVVGFVGAAIVARAFPATQLRVTPELVLIVLLPGLVFEAGFRLDLHDVRRASAGLAILAVPGVLLSAAVVAVVLNVATGLRFELAFVVGAMVSATDPVAVISTFRQLPTPEALPTLVEGESLLNDGTGLVLYTIAVGALSQPTSLIDGIGTFTVAVSMSAVVGIAAGSLAIRLLALTDDHLVELTISLVLAYGTYLAADELHASGIIATVVAAVVLGTYGRSRAISPAGAEALDLVWEFFAFVLTAVVFLLIGFAIDPGSLVSSAGPIAWAVGGALVARALVAYGLLGIPAWVAGRLRSGGAASLVPLGWLHIVFWAGLRGAVAVAMALALPEDIEQRALLQQITFGVVLFTLVVQGTTATRVVTLGLRRAAGD